MILFVERTHFEKEIPVEAVFSQDEMINIIGATSRWHNKKLLGNH